MKIELSTSQINNLLNFLDRVQTTGINEAAALANIANVLIIAQQEEPIEKEG